MKSYDTPARPTYQTNNFISAGSVDLYYLTSFGFNSIIEIKESYRTHGYAIGSDSYEMGAEYALYNNYLVTRTCSLSECMSYSYKLNMGSNFCDLCVDGHSRTVVDCNQNDWWRHDERY